MHPNSECPTEVSRAAYQAGSSLQGGYMAIFDII